MGLGERETTETKKANMINKKQIANTSIDHFRVCCCFFLLWLNHVFILFFVLFFHFFVFTPLSWYICFNQLLFSSIWKPFRQASRSVNMINYKRHALDGRTYHSISIKIPISDPGSTIPETGRFRIGIKIDHSALGILSSKFQVQRKGSRCRRAKARAALGRIVIVIKCWESWSKLKKCFHWHLSLSIKNPKSKLWWFLEPSALI